MPRSQPPGCRRELCRANGEVRGLYVVSLVQRHKGDSLSIGHFSVDGCLGEHDHRPIVLQLDDNAGGRGGWSLRAFGTDLAPRRGSGGWRRCRLLKPRWGPPSPREAFERRPVLPPTTTRSGSRHHSRPHAPASSTWHHRPGQCSGPGGVVFSSGPIASILRRQTASPAQSPASASSSARIALSMSASSP